MRQCDQVIDKKLIKYLTQKKPQPPTLKAQTKLHKPGNLILRPVVNNIQTPSYKLAKHLGRILPKYEQLSNTYNIQNSTTLDNELTKIKIGKQHRLLTYDIKELYVNISIQETLKIAEEILAKERNKQTSQ
jgi:hypothetical protein